MSKIEDNEAFVRHAQSVLGLKTDGWAGKKTYDAFNDRLGLTPSVPHPAEPGDAYEVAFDKTISHEGGFQNNPKDRGNWTGGAVGKGVNKGTKYGIAAASYPDLDISNLELADAKSIYRRDFWEKIHADEMPAAIGYMAFDMAVNHGRSLSAQLIQKALGVAQDGRIGDITLGAINKANTLKLIDGIADAREAKYRSLAAASSNYAEFLGSESPRKGWLGRNLNVRDEARAMA
jgi:lysozyme family protein